MEHKSITLPKPTPDQAAYLDMIHKACTEYDGSYVVGGPKKQVSQELFWLVEKYLAGKLVYWCAGAKGRAAQDGWTSDVSFATKLGDRESADQVLIYLCGGEGRSAQHQFILPA